MQPGLRYPSGDLDVNSWVRVSKAVGTLEESWKAEKAVELASLIPEQGDVDRVPILIELLKVDQEFRWLSGDQRRVEDYLADWPELATSSSHVAELIEAECLTLAAFGGSIPTLEDIQNRFPQAYEQVNLDAVAQQAGREQQSLKQTQYDELADTKIQTDVSVLPLQMPNLPASLLPLLGRYIPIKELGKGGMGSVFLAYDKQLTREVALKIPREEITNTANGRARFVKEAQAAAGLKHPGICTVYDFAEVEGTCYITMELVKGPGLDNLVSEGPMAPLETASIVQKITKALAAIHEAKIVHRDIKPSNVMLENGEPLLMDFGLVRWDQGDQAQTGLGMVGTLHYMSPQQINNSRADVSSDIYSLGVVLYEMLTGKRPFQGNQLQLMNAINLGKHPSISSLVSKSDPELESICMKAMAREPQDRYASATEFGAALNEYLAPLTDPAIASDRHQRISRRTLVKFVGAVSVVLLAGLMIFFKTGDGVIEIEIDGESSTVTIDGDRVKIENGSIKVTVGSHIVEIVRKDGKKLRQTINIRWRSSSVKIETHRIQGTVWNDINGDGKRRGEKPIPDQLVWLDLNRDGLLDANEPRQKTDELGEFRFTGLIPDRYLVRQQLEPDWEQTSPTALLYEEDFSSDPGWVTPHPDRYRWDKGSGEYLLTQRNVNGSKTEHAHHDLGLAFESFRLEFDVFLSDVDYASGVKVGLFDSDLNSGGDGSCTYVSFTFADTAPGVQRYFVALQFSNSEGRAGSTQNWIDRENPPSDPQIIVNPHQWYRVVMEYDVEQEKLTANVRSRDSGDLIGQLLIPDAGPFASDMTRLGSSNCRTDKFQAANAQSTVRIDNLRLFLTSCRPHTVELSANLSQQTINFENRQLARVEGTVREDTNGDGRIDDNEPGLPRKSVFVDENANGQHDAGEPLALTDESGRFQFGRLHPGIHIIGLVVPDSHEQALPPARDWQPFQGKWYALTRMHGSWELCEADARAAGGHLVTINNAEENAWLAQQYKEAFLAKQPGNPICGYVWIGLYRSSSEWQWISGEDSDFRPGWWNGKPYLGRGTSHAALSTGEQRGGVWENSLGRPITPGDFPRGVIELPPDRRPRDWRLYAISLAAAEQRTDIDFGLSRRQP
jgi:serine/threonine protein kinase